MANRRYEMYEYRQVLVRMRQGDSDRAIARTKLMGRDKARQVRAVATEKGWLDREVPLPADAELAKELYLAPEASKPSSLEPYREEVVAWRREGIQGTTILRLLQRKHGYPGSYSSVRRFLRKLDPEPRQRTMRLSFAPGEAAQVDFGVGPLLPDLVTGEPRRTWIFVMTLCWSRHQYAEVVFDQKVETWLGCHMRAFRFFGGVVERVIIDNAKCGVVRACRCEPEAQRSYAELAEAYDFRIDACPPYEPQKKGRVEAGVKYVKRAFLPGRDFRDLAEANAQLEQWLLGEAGNRIHGTTRERPLTRFVEIERHQLRDLPTQTFKPARWRRLRVHKDAHIRFEKCFYSAPWVWIGQRLWVRVTADMVHIFRNHELLAAHPRLARPGKSATVVEHLPPEAQAHLRKTPDWCRDQATRVGEACAELVDRLFADRITENLRAARGLIALRKSYGAERLEAACRRALDFENPRFRAVQTILAKGLDQLEHQEAGTALAEIYTGSARFHRNTRDMLAN